MKRLLLMLTPLAILLLNSNNLAAQEIAGSVPQPKESNLAVNASVNNDTSLLGQNNSCRMLTLPHDGKIRILVKHFNEFVDITYLDQNGCWIPEAYEKIKHSLRSRGDNKEGDFDKRLVELADHLQDHFQTDTVDVISGYRSSEFNQSLKNAGRGVASNSRHTRGGALDVHLPNVNDSTVRDYLLALKLGGVGYYKDMMVHMDFGPVRRW